MKVSEYRKVHGIVGKKKNPSNWDYFKEPQFYAVIGTGVLVLVLIVWLIWLLKEGGDKGGFAIPVHIIK